jgi:hypothetical protein
MKWISAERLLTLLHPLNFRQGLATRAAGSLTFVRRSSLSELFDSIIVDCQGRNGEAVYASVGISATRTVMYKVLGDVRLIEVLADNKDRGWTVIDDANQAKYWERRLAAVAQQEVADWAAQVGPRILEQTRNARAAAVQYLERLRHAGGADEVLKQLQARASQRTADAAKRLFESPGGSGVAGTESAYRAACYALMLDAKEVEVAEYLTVDSAATNVEVMMRIHLLADRLQFSNWPDQ